MQQHLIDICIPTFEPQEAHLHEAIRSALAQTEQCFRIMIHDDASVQDVHAMVEPFLGDPRISFSRSPKRLGIGGNWNVTMHKGTGSYIQFLFQDDVWEPAYLAHALRALEENPSATLASVGHHYAFEAPLRQEHATYGEIEGIRTNLKSGLHRGTDLLQWWLERQLHPNIIGEPSFVILRRDAIEHIGDFKETMPQFLDVEYWIRCLLQGDAVVLHEDLGSFRVHSGAASARNTESGEGIYDRLCCFNVMIAKLPPGKLRSQAIEARNTALVVMAKKFFSRVKRGGKVPIKGSGNFRAFVLRHPFLLARATLHALYRNS